jgi:hypothetical protein
MVGTSVHKRNAVYGTADGEDEEMPWKRYVNRTECWARVVEEDVEDIVGSTGRTTAYGGDMVVNQNLRGQTFTYVLTRDEFDNNWRDPGEVDTDTKESEYGDPAELEAATVSEDESTTGDNVVDEDQADEDAPPAPTASAPTSAASGDAATPAGNPPTVPDTSGNDTPAVSPVSGTATPVEPVEAPVGSGASDATLDATEPAPDTENPAAEPATTTPTQTVEPASEPGGTGTATAEDTAGQVTSTDETGGGDEGAAPTPTVDVQEAPAEPNTNTEPTANAEPAADAQAAQVEGTKDVAPPEGGTDAPEGAVKTQQLPGAHRKEEG